MDSRAYHRHGGGMMKSWILGLVLAGCASAGPTPAPRGLPDSAWYPPVEPAPPYVPERFSYEARDAAAAAAAQKEPPPYQSPPIDLSGVAGYSRQELTKDLVKVDCDAVIADWREAKAEFERVVDAYQAKHCKPKMSRTVAMFEDGSRRYTGEFHPYWVCDGVVMGEPARPRGVTVRQVDLQGCKRPHLPGR